MILTGALVACSSDDTVVTDDAGSDVNTSPDTSRVDGSDTDVDAGVADTGTDVHVDAGLKVETYDEQVANTLCDSLTRCCYANGNVPDGGAVDAGGPDGGGFFDRASCLSIYIALGFESSNVGLAQTTKNVVVNQAKGAECIEKLKTLACDLDGVTLKGIRSACFAALEGQLKVGDTCTATIECGKGSFCSGTTVDGGFVGTCAPLRTQGQNCSLQNTGSEDEQEGPDTNVGETACSHRGGGDTGLRCSSWDPGTGLYNDDRATWTCQPQVADGEFCNTTVSCATGVCEPGVYVCKPVLAYFNESACFAHLDK